jgi:hypothetical protein
MFLDPGVSKSMQSDAKLQRDFENELILLRRVLPNNCEASVFCFKLGDEITNWFKRKTKIT